MTDDLNHIRIEQMSDGTWRTWIPASKPEHREGDMDMGVYGNTYHGSLYEAVAFMAMTAYPDMVRTGWEPKYLPYTDDEPEPTRCCQCIERFPISPPAATTLAPRVAGCPTPDHPERPWTYQFVPICDDCKSDWWGLNNADRPPHAPPFMVLPDEWVGC